MNETLSRTLAGRLRPRRVGEPRAAAARSPTGSGGHVVQGHVDGVGTVGAVDVGRVRAPGRDRGAAGGAALRRREGSIAVDGVSLTVAELGRAIVYRFPDPGDAASAPISGMREPGDTVNLEVDVLAKYVEKLMGQGR